MSEIPIRVTAEPCPICAKPARSGFAPFCSARCADVDLGRWLSDRYVIPAPDDADADEAPSTPGDGHSR